MPKWKKFHCKRVLGNLDKSLGQIFSWFVGLPEAGLVQLKPHPVTCSVLESSPRDCTCLTDSRQSRSFLCLGLLSTHDLCESAFNSRIKCKMCIPFYRDIPFLGTYSTKNLTWNMHIRMFLETLFLMVIPTKKSWTHQVSAKCSHWSEWVHL